MALFRLALRSNRTGLLATALIGAFLGERATTAGLHQLALAMTVVAVGLVAVSAASRRRVA